MRANNSFRVSLEIPIVVDICDTRQNPLIEVLPVEMRSQIHGDFRLPIQNRRELKKFSFLHGYVTYIVCLDHIEATYLLDITYKNHTRRCEHRGKLREKSE